MKLETAIQKYLVARTGEVADDTVKWYRCKLEYVKDALGELEVTDITVDDLYKWRADLHNKNTLYENHPYRHEIEGQGLSIYTLHNIIVATRALFNWLHQRGEILHNVALPIKPPNLPKKRNPKAVEEDDLDKLLEAAEDNPRDYAIIQVLADTGARIGGIAYLKLTDLNLREGELLVTEKGGKKRTVYITEEPKQALRRWLKKRPRDTDWVFPSAKGGRLTRSGYAQMLERLAKRAKAKGRVNPHAFRHRFARELLDNGSDLGVVADLMGHEDIATTKECYGIWTEKELKLKHRQFSPQRNRKKK